MPLYKVTVEFETIVYAEDEDAAISEAERVVTAEDEIPTTDAIEIKSVEDIPTGWDKDCIPWGSAYPYDKTIEEILNQ